jgi:hypothetical protein
MPGGRRSRNAFGGNHRNRYNPAATFLRLVLYTTLGGCDSLTTVPMPKISVLLHTHNDALHLGRALESLRPCDEVLVIDNCSEDDTARVAREYGVTLKSAIPGVTPGTYALDTKHNWVLCLRPGETLSDDLEASLFEWKNQEPAEGVACYGISIREQQGQIWQRRSPEVRLVNRQLINWTGEMPPNQRCEMTLSGDLLCFRQP